MKKTTAVVKMPTRELVKATFLDQADEDAGKGISTAPDDNVTPIIRLLQALSAQVKKNNPSYVKGAEAGDIWLKDNPSGKSLVKGEVGILFQPCYFYKDVIEWRPLDDGGGFVRRWDAIPRDAEEHTDEKTGRVFYTRNGNELVDTRNHPGFVIDEETGEASPWVLPMKGSNHQVSRAWMPLMQAKRLPSGKKAPAWFWVWRVKTRSKVNAAGQDYYVFDVEEVREIETDEEYARGKAVYEAFDSGVKRAEVDVEEMSATAFKDKNQSM